MKALGLDIGTTTISAVIFDPEERAVCRAKTIPNQCFIETGNDWERIQDAERIAEKAFDLASEMLDEDAEIASIGLTGQMHGILYLDKEGNCVSPLYTWQDGRGNLSEERGMSLVQEIRDRCGITASSGYGLVSHLYNRRHGLVPEDAAGLCTIGDYLGMKLTGRKRPLMHAGNAASLGFFDEISCTFRTDLLSEMGMEKGLSFLPELTEDFARLGFFRGRPVSAAIGDNQASFLGSAGTEKNVVLVNMGTGGQISVLSDRHFTAPGIEARPFRRGEYLLAGSSLCGGRAYAILEGFFRSLVTAAGGPDRPVYELMGRLAREGAALQDPMTAVTAFSGTRVDPDLRGSFQNVSEDNFTPASMTIAVLRGMAEELHQMYDLIREGTGITALRLIGSGNGLRLNPALQDVFRGTFQLPLSLSPFMEEAACGAAMCSCFRDIR